MLNTKSLSEGNNTVRIVRLLERLSGYLKIYEIIYNNYYNMIKYLKMDMKKSFDNNEVAQCESFRVSNENKQFNRYIKSAN